MLARRLRDVDDATIAAIRRIWLDRKVVFFPGQHLDEGAHQAFGERFGELTEGHPVVPGVDGFPNIFEIDYSKARQLYGSYGDVAFSALRSRLLSELGVADSSDAPPVHPRQEYLT